MNQGHRDSANLRVRPWAGYFLILVLYRGLEAAAEKKCR
jgi:hypothetical protein